MQGPADLEQDVEKAASDLAEATVQAIKALMSSSDEPSRVRREALALARAVPGRVHASGLMRGLVDLAAQGASNGAIKANSVPGCVLHDALRWLSRSGGPFGRDPVRAVSLAVLEDVIQAREPEHVAWAQEDLQRYLGWLKRLVEIESGGDK